MTAVPITPGMTEWAVAQRYGVSVSAVEAANGVSPTDLQVGQTLIVPSGGSWSPPGPSQSASGSSEDTPSSPQSAPEPPPQPSGASPSSVPSSGGGGGSGFHIPGMSDSMASCIAFRESTSGTNPAANGNVFGIIPASGYNVAGDSLAQQERVAGQIYASAGGAAWSADGCPGT